MVFWLTIDTLALSSVRMMIPSCSVSWSGILWPATTGVF